ncbi:MAG: carbohydrate ABC transporter permease [Oscillospiraceae bacterium]|jgi:raffinose/stachyose/melibiose transport system permease protein|nr:carbohydrate ABC transporter permease [Oscillospiraceae bacterium]
MKTRFPLGRGIILAVLLLFSVIQLFPLVWLIDFSLASNTEFFTSKLLIMPKEIQWGNYPRAFIDGHFLLYLKNSLLVNTLAVVVVLVLSICSAYAVTRMRWKFSQAAKSVILLGMMIPIHATLIPNYMIYDFLGVRDTLWSLLLPYVAFSLPQGLFLAASYMESVSKEIEEAAIIDGCGTFRLLGSIITPMMKSSLITVMIMTYLNNWNEFMMASTYLSTSKWKTLPFSILEFTGQYRANVAVQFAVMTLTAAPAIIIYIILSKHITKGVAMGAVKG